MDDERYTQKVKKPVERFVGLWRTTAPKSVLDPIQPSPYTFAEYIDVQRIKIEKLESDLDSTSLQLGQAINEIQNDLDPQLFTALLNRQGALLVGDGATDEMKRLAGALWLLSPHTTPAAIRTAIHVAKEKG